MKSFIADTLIGIFAIDEAGNILNFIDFNGNNKRIIEFYNALEQDIILKEYEKFLSDLKNSGFNVFILDNSKLKTLTEKKLGYKTEFKSTSLELKNFRLNLQKQLKKFGIEKNQDEILKQYKEISEELTRKKVKRAGAQTDMVIIQTITTLDVLKKSISLFSSRLREWYGLHFPELSDKLIEDNIVLAKLVSTLGSRDNYTIKNIEQHFNFQEQTIQKLEKNALKSMGADIDLKIIQDYANQIIELDLFRDELEGYLDSLMEQLAPNIKRIVGSLIGAKLIAKVGGLKKLSFIPASRIQILGAEKALYRFLKTGDKRPKHGLIFQWNQIRSAKPWIRGKIARLISGKIGLAAKVDFFSGDFIGDKLMIEIEEKIKKIEKKYPNPPKKAVRTKVKVKKKRKR
jgi:nucleolar protein 56